MEKMTVKGFIIGARPWTMTDEVTGEIRQGVSLQYITGDMKPCFDEETGQRGFAVAKSSIPIDKIMSIGSVPAEYNLTFEPKIIGGKVSLKLKDVEEIKKK